jgi:IS5 family transposase
MRPKERRDSGQNDLFKARLDQIVDMNHALAKLAQAVNWGFLEKSFGAVYADIPGRPPLPTRLMAGLAILKHMHNLSDEVLCERWVENPYYQLFCGEEFFRHKLTFDRSSLTRWRQRMGEEKLVALIQESLSVATRTGAAKRAGEGGRLSHRRQADASRARMSRAARQETRHRLAPILCACR